MTNDPIRVLRIVSVMNRGGIETQIMNIYRNLDRNKFQFDFLVTREQEGVFDKEIKQLGGKVYSIPSVRKVGMLRFIKSIDRFFKEHPEYRVVHCHMNTWSGLFLNIARKNNVPIRIAQSHSAQQRQRDVNLRSVIENGFKRFMRLFIKKGATHFWACGMDAGNWLYGPEIASTKLTVVPNAKDIESFAYKPKIREEMRASLGISAGTIILGHVGSFSEIKNQSFLIEIFEQILKQKYDCRLCLVGDGPLKEDIEKKVYERNLADKVMFLGLRNDVNNLMSMFDTIILPSLFEGLPNVIIEAQAAALPCVISDRVTSEVDLGMGLIDFVGLEEPPENWARVVLKRRDIRRTMSVSKIIERGYDLKTFIKWLEDFYTNCRHA